MAHKRNKQQQQHGEFSVSCWGWVRGAIPKQISSPNIQYAKFSISIQLPFLSFINILSLSRYLFSNSLSLSVSLFSGLTAGIHPFIWLSEKGFIFREQFKFRIISKIWMNPHRDEEISKYSHKMSEINGIVYLIAFGYSHKILYVSLRLCHSSSISLFVRVCECVCVPNLIHSKIVHEQNWNKDEFPFKNIDSLSLQYSLSSNFLKHTRVFTVHISIHIIHTHYTREQHTILSTEILPWSRYHLTTIFFSCQCTVRARRCYERSKTNAIQCAHPFTRCDFNVITNSNGIDFIVTIA